MRLMVFVTAGLACAAGAVPDHAGQSNGGARVAIRPRARPRQATGTAGALRVNVRMVLIPVSVTDPLGAPFPGLTAASFRVLEGGVEQRIRYFATEDAPISVGMVFDASRSMQGKLDQSREAITRFFRTSLPGDEFLVVEFNDAPRLLCDFTTDTELIESTLAGIQPRNWTALLDAVYMAVQKMKHARNPRKALVILSDGADNNSRYTESEMKSLVRESDVCIYSIGLAGGFMNRHIRLLRNLADQTGGRAYVIGDVHDLPPAVEALSAAVRNQYLLGYSPTNGADDGMFRKVEVRVNQQPGSPRLHVSWRTGYYAPSGAE